MGRYATEKDNAFRPMNRRKSPPSAGVNTVFIGHGHESTCIKRHGCDQKTVPIHNTLASSHGVLWAGGGLNDLRTNRLCIRWRVDALIAPLTPFHRRSLFNIGLAMPELSPRPAKNRLGMWAHLGRVLGNIYTKTLVNHIASPMTG